MQIAVNNPCNSYSYCKELKMTSDGTIQVYCKAFCVTHKHKNQFHTQLIADTLAGPPSDKCGPKIGENVILTTKT